MHVHEMRSLKNYVLHRNSVASFFRRKPISLHNLSKQDYQELLLSLQCNLSPENLHQDGEISAQEAEQTFNYLSDVAIELNILAKQQGIA